MMSWKTMWIQACKGFDSMLPVYTSFWEGVRLGVGGGGQIE